MPLSFFSSCLTHAHYCLSVQHHSQSPCRDYGSILCRAALLFLSIVCICHFLNSSSGVKLFSSNPFPFSRFLQKLLVPTQQTSQYSWIPSLPSSFPHSMLNLLLGDAGRELRCSHLSCGSACVCVHTDVMCTRLLFSESLLFSNLTGQCSGRNNKSYT